MSTQGISAVIITYNEAENIARCIESLLPVANEVLVIDSGSTDDTVPIATKLGARVLQNPFEGYGQQKNFGNALAAFDWILSVDADEALDKELAASILQEVNAPKGQVYRTRRLNWYCGQFIRHGAWYPDYKIRFWRKEAATWSHDAVHEQVLTQAQVQTLDGHLLHYTIPTVEAHIAQAKKFALLGQRFPISPTKRFFKKIYGPIGRFVNGYFLKLGFLDGWRGLYIASISAWSEWIKYSRP